MPGQQPQPKRPWGPSLWLNLVLVLVVVVVVVVVVAASNC